MDDFRAVVADRLAATATPARLRLIALAVALTAHAALLYALMTPAADTLAGGGGQQFDAISVTVISSAALESLQADLAQPPAPIAAGNLETNEGAAESPPEAQQEEPKEEALQEEKSPPEPPQTAAIIPTPREEQKQESQGDGTARRRRHLARRCTCHREPARSRSGERRRPARVRELRRAGARQGQAERRRHVRHGQDQLVIAPAGGLAAVQIAKTSGNKKLDAMAIAAVQHAALPAPPAGFTPAQLTYEIPYHFR